MSWKTLGVIALAALAFAGVSQVAHAAGVTDVDVPACEVEDGSGQPGLCVWDSATMGNHAGTGTYLYRDGVLISRW